MFTSGEPIKEIAQKYNCNPSTILYKLKEWGFDTSRKSWNLKKYKVDETFFEKIDSKEKSYLLGFIVADGHISKNGALMIAVHKKDEKILNLIKEKMESEHPIKESKSYGTIGITIGSSKICSDLINKGLNNNKSYYFDTELLFSSIPIELMSHFIRGYFDGDGCIKIYNQTNYPDKKIYHFSILGIEKMITEIAKILELEDWRISKDKRTASTYQLICRSKSDIIRIGDYLYNDSDDLYLNRKHDTFLEIK